MAWWEIEHWLLDMYCRASTDAITVHYSWNDCVAFNTLRLPGHISRFAVPIESSNKAEE